ncbi:Uma2 family endonuclease [Streptomyces sp. NPDC001404]|uniref:Uma2 family endonuclease n=1 Tax=Streptomyces sp. NPDC001404 TaxID=3364571 RepID=UPI0036A44734
MTIAPTDNEGLDEMFELLCKITPEGYKSEIVGGAILMTPKRDEHWDIISDVLSQLIDHFGDRSGIMHDVRLDLPGYGNAFAPGLYKLRGGAEHDAKDNWRYQDVDFVLEVTARGTADREYGAKKAAYAAGGIPVHVIADPYMGRCHVHTLPVDGEYRSRLVVDFGEPIDLTGTILGLTLTTWEFARG